ncbi:DUF362 domain-containing protein [Desulfohalovibrio reitneri]|uniref:DUF362 domain-containing protein n=1 Tax=Desulfohalovibrio reitneri TaxID=1307759 RepID=UPI0004A6C1AE|nr:DUF362 domain-containing protein [Desulfohalovibrio reitneri]
MSAGTSSIPVALAAVPGYDAFGLLEAARRCLAAAGVQRLRGARVLVKPNLVSPKNPLLTCTRAEVVRAACLALREAGADPWVGDSPAFGSAASVARAAGYPQALADLDVPIRGLGRAVPLDFADGGCIGVSRAALEADLICNLPKAKAHGQVRLTLAAKNLFGCVVGARKALAHARMGEKANRFESMLCDVAAALPPGVSLLDGVEAMHVDGPQGGEPFHLGMLAACRDPFALDTALYGLLGVTPDEVPLWREARERGLPGAFAENLSFPLDRPESFDASGFEMPGRLSPVTFDPFRLLKGRLKSFVRRFK